MSFQSRDSHSSPLIKSNHILKLIENIFFTLITIGAIDSWNKTQHHFSNVSLKI